MRFKDVVSRAFSPLDSSRRRSRCDRGASQIFACLSAYLIQASFVPAGSTMALSLPCLLRAHSTATNKAHDCTGPVLETSSFRPVAQPTAPAQPGNFMKYSMDRARPPVSLTAFATALTCLYRHSSAWHHSHSTFVAFNLLFVWPS